MKDLKRQDRNGVRTAVDLERRYKFKDINLTKEEVDYLKTLIVVDSALSTTSTNAVQNKVITEALNKKLNISNFLTNMEIEELIDSIVL